MATRIQRTVAWLGGRKVLGRTVHTEFDLERVVKAGLPAQALDALTRAEGLTRDEVGALILPVRTWLHRKARRQRLTLTESDKARRVARILALADETFSDHDTAAIWLRRPNRALGRLVPMTLLETEGGGRLVEDELVRIADGVFA